MNTPDVERQIAPKKANIPEGGADMMKAAATRLPRLWVIVILGVLSWLLVVFVCWFVYTHWIAPGVMMG